MIYKLLFGFSSDNTEQSKILENDEYLFEEMFKNDTEVSIFNILFE